MSQTIDVVFEDNVLKPVTAISGIKEHTKATIIICAPVEPQALRRLSGTLSHAEADAMRNTIKEAFEGTEGEW
jgi:predicted DNA-binding antitoxin AbrB/MazE fold protein